MIRRSTAAESLNNPGNRRSQQNTLNDFMPRQVSQQRTNYREERGIIGAYKRQGLPEGWVAMRSRETGDEYYVNEIIGGKGQYEFPTEPARGLNRAEIRRPINRDTNMEQRGTSHTPYREEIRGENRRNGSNVRSSGNREALYEWGRW